MKAKSKRVLIVEDDLSLEPLWKVIIRRCFDSAEIEWAVSSEQARTLIRNMADAAGAFDLIIADLFLAGSHTGLEFLRSAEVLSTKAKTMLVSMASQTELEAHCRKVLPKSKIVTKPLSVVKCERAIDEMVAYGV